MKTFVLIYNPVSGRQYFLKKLDFVIANFQARGIVLLPYRTTRDNGEELIAFLREISPQGILIAGGDGTVHVVVNLLLKNNLTYPIGILPSGTSNDFATYLGIKSIDEKYLDNIAQQRVRRVDVGKANDEYFINVASGGIFTSIAHRVDIRLKHLLGKTAYYIHSLGELSKIKTFPLHIEADGTVHEEDVFLFVVINSDVIGSIKQVIDGVKIDDGELDLVLIRPCNFKVLLEITAHLFAGKSIAERKEVVHLKAQKFFLQSTEVFETDLDGELGPTMPLHIEAIPRALEMFY